MDISSINSTNPINSINPITSINWTLMEDRRALMGH